jgi:hypothetical protein
MTKFLGPQLPRGVTLDQVADAANILDSVYGEPNNDENLVIQSKKI